MVTGTVVDTKVVHPRNYDFYMCAHAGMIVSLLISGLNLCHSGRPNTRLVWICGDGANINCKETFMFLLCISLRVIYIFIVITYELVCWLFS